MNLRDFVQDRTAAVIEQALRLAAECGITRNLTLAWIPDERSSWDRRDHQTARFGFATPRRLTGATWRSLVLMPGAD